MNTDQSLRKHVIELLNGGHAHVTLDAALADMPEKLRGVRPAGLPHSAWRLLEHLRICQWDILEFSRNPKHVSPKFPDGYWPAGDSSPDAAAWDKSLAAFRADLQAMKDLVNDPKQDLLKPFPHGDGQTLLREALLVADHNAYHLGQLIIVRRLLGAWPEDK